MKIIKIMISVLLAALFVSLAPAQVFADSQVEYIAEVKIGMDKDASDAAAALEGYTILKDGDGNYADLNNNAGGGFGSKGDKVVYLGYKTTTDRSEAITDLAVMNMKGGYSVEDYEVLMETQMKSQIIPFVDTFLAVIREYRENVASDNPENKTRADYVRSLLNKLTDDDCGGAGLGDLLLNETKYEMGDEAYNALSDDEKKNHADILTIVAQANGQATILLENLLVKASDPGEDTWIDRFAGITYDDLVESVGMLPSEAEAELSKAYYDDAMKLLGSWDALYTDLCEKEESLARVEEGPAVDYAQMEEKYKDYDLETAEASEVGEAITDVLETDAAKIEQAKDFGTVAIFDYLQCIDYGDGTLLDFFMRDEDEVADDITSLYPLIASLSDGQRAGLSLISLRELILMTQCDESLLDETGFDEQESVSIYEGVNRDIYQKGAVALTSDALRQKADVLAEQTFSGMSFLTGLMIGVSALSVAGFIASAVYTVRQHIHNAAMEALAGRIADLENAVVQSQRRLDGIQKTIAQLSYRSNGGFDLNAYLNLKNAYSGAQPAEVSPQLKQALADEAFEKAAINANRENISTLQEQMANSGNNNAQALVSNKLMIGMGIAAVVITGITLWLSYRDLVNHYKVTFTPIPFYMIDEKDLVAYDENGDKIVLKNQSAYYAAVTCNRTDKDEMFDELGVCADLNGDVGKQWLALYAVKNETEKPILATSLKVVTDSDELPAGYETGIHMFGSESAFNLNNSLYVWNSGADSVFVYFQRDSASSSTAAGTAFTNGVAAVTGVGGLALGAAAAVLIMKLTGRKKKSTAAA